MYIEPIALLQLERDLHDVPRGMERFREYIRALTNDDQTDVKYGPLGLMNPMGREHIAARLDELIALQAEALAVEAAATVMQRLTDIDGTFKHGWTICDDVQGGWTNRYTTDAALRFGDYALASIKRGWLQTAWWASVTPTVAQMREELLSSMYRGVYLSRHGAPQTLADVLRQEGEAAAFAGMQPSLSADDLDYSRYVIAPLRESTDFTVWMAALYGDPAAHSLGYPPLGLTAFAGLAVACAEHQS